MVENLDFPFGKARFVKPLLLSHSDSRSGYYQKNIYLIRSSHIIKILLWDCPKEDEKNVNRFVKSVFSIQK